MVIPPNLSYRRVGLIFLVVKMDDIECHPEKSFRDPGSSYQVSARPKASDETALEVESDVTDKRKVHFTPYHPRDPDIQEGYKVQRRRKGKLPCCNIL